MHAQVYQMVSSLDSLPSEWQVVPTFGKRPLGEKWQNNTYSPKKLQAKLLSHNMKIWLAEKKRYVVPTGIALVCGYNHPQGYLTAIDCDGVSSWGQILKINENLQLEELNQLSPIEKHKRALEYLPPTIAFTSGRDYRSQHLYIIPSPKDEIKSRKIKTGKDEHLELRGKNLCSVLPPSYHPEGRIYKWLPGCNPNECQVQMAPDWIVAQMLVKQEKKRVLNLPQDEYDHKYGIDKYAHLYPQIDDNIQTALILLEVIHPRFADDYWSWIQVGMALKSVSPTLLKAWDCWSQLSPKYKPGECVYKWHSFRRQGITIRTLAKFANLS